MPTILVTISPENEETCRGCGLLLTEVGPVFPKFTCRAGLQVRSVNNGNPARPQSCLERVATAELLKLHLGSDYILP